MNTIFPDFQLRTLKPPMTPDELLATLRSNAPRISPHEISNFLQNLDHDLHLYDKLIHRIHANQAALRCDAARYASLNAPIRKLPPEVLRRIFRFSVGQFGYSYYKRESTVFHLSSVCSRWRQVTLSAPELWASMCINLGQRAFQPVKLSLSRSQHHPLSLQLHSRRVEESENDLKLFSLLLEHSHRWQHLNVLQHWNTLQAIEEVPALESIHCYPSDLQVIPVHSALKLQQVVLWFEHVDDTVNKSDLPWVSVRHIEISAYNSLQSIIQCLRAGKGLQSCIFLYDGRSPNAFSPQLRDEDHITSNITSLSCELIDPLSFYAALCNIIQLLTLPSLNHLTISHKDMAECRSDEFEGEWPRDALNNLMDRSRCNLTTLTLSEFPLTDSDVLSLLQSTPAVHTFTLHEISGTKEGYAAHGLKNFQTVTNFLLKRLSDSLSTPGAVSFRNPLVPKLNSLTLKVQSLFDADQAFVDLVKSRWIRPSHGLYSYNTETLRTVELYVCNRILSKEVYEPLRMIEKDGMMISVFQDAERII